MYLDHAGDLRDSLGKELFFLLNEDKKKAPTHRNGEPGPSSQIQLGVSPLFQQDTPFI